MKKTLNALVKNVEGFATLVKDYKAAMDVMLTDNWTDDDYDTACKLYDDICDVFCDANMTLDQMDKAWNSIGKKYVDWWND